MKIPRVDLRAQYGTIREEIGAGDAGIADPVRMGVHGIVPVTRSGRTERRSACRSMWRSSGADTGARN